LCGRIPTSIVFDADADKPDKNGSRAQHEKDYKALLALAGLPGENPMPDATIWGRGSGTRLRSAKRQTDQIVAKARRR